MATRSVYLYKEFQAITTIEFMDNKYSGCPYDGKEAIEKMHSPRPGTKKPPRLSQGLFKRNWNF
jgi:hypothetical protein